jgi:RNA-directed DNA polymerase
VKTVKLIQMDYATTVLEAATPVEEAGPKRPKTEPCVWTERMLAALERGVKGGKWFSLIDKVTNRKTLNRAWELVRSNRGAAGVDRQSVSFFAKDAARHLAKLQQELEAGNYVPYPVLRCWIDKAGSKDRRPLGIPAVRDRIVQTALLLVIGPIFEVTFAPRSYGFRPGRGCKTALRVVDRLLKKGQVWVVDADLKSYFDTIPHSRLMGYVEEHIADGQVLKLIRAYLKAGVMDGLELWTSETGTPQGAVISPMLSNIYLNALDHEMAELGFSMVRYADDFVVLCRSREEAGRALEIVKTYTDAHDLQLHPVKTRLIDASIKGGFDFLGYHFERGYRWPSKKALNKLKDTIRAKTRKTNGQSLKAIIDNVNKTLVGWFGYFKHSHKTTFGIIDGWLRERLRTILRKRHKGKGRARRSDHIRWPNAYFANHGLFFLKSAHCLICQSLLRATH